MTVNEILNEMLASVSYEYDTSEGSFFYDMLYPVAVRIYMIQSLIDSLSDNAFALTAKGEYLDRKAAEQGIKRRAASYAHGTVRIYGTKGAAVSEKSKVAAGDVLFETETAAVIPEIGYIDVPAVCIVSGTAGNVKAGTINRFPVTLPKLTDVTNPQAFTGGYAEESDDELLKRYLERVSRPNVNGNKNQYIEWAKEVVGVGDASVVPLWNGAGTVKVVIVDTDNKPANGELIQKVKEHIDENRPIGANVTVVSASALKVKISVRLTTNEESVKANIEKSISSYLSYDALKKSYISYAKIGGCILSANGVDDYSELTVNGSTSNITIPEGVVPVLESVVIV